MNAEELQLKKSQSQLQAQTKYHLIQDKRGIGVALTCKSGRQVKPSVEIVLVCISTSAISLDNSHESDVIALILALH